MPLRGIFSSDEADANGKGIDDNSNPSTTRIIATTDLDTLGIKSPIPSLIKELSL